MDEGVGEPVPMGRTCAWCSHAAPVEATQCPSCGAALAQRETIGDLVIPGLTSVRADLLDAEERPLHIPGSSATQGIASGAIIGAMIGGPVGLAAIGATAVVGAAEYLSATRQGAGAPALEDVGRPDPIAAMVVDRLDHGSAPSEPADPDAPERSSADPWRDLPG